MWEMKSTKSKRMMQSIYTILSLYITNRVELVLYIYVYYFKYYI